MAMKYLFGTKLEMTQVFDEKGRVIPVTAVSVPGCVVTQVRTKERDGYTALQLGLGVKKNVSKGLSGHYAKASAFPKGKGFRFVREVRVDETDAQVGDKVASDVFAVGDTVMVTGRSKGRGFQGVVKRHHFRGGPASHGHKDNLRMPGSIGAGGIQHVLKGMRMGGHMGDAQITTKGLSVVSVDLEEKIIYIKGSVPGARGGLVLITGEGEMRFESQTSSAPAVEEVSAAPVAEEKQSEEEAKDVSASEESAVAAPLPSDDTASPDEAPASVEVAADEIVSEETPSAQ